jgi:hypothetical protein
MLRVEEEVLGRRAALGIRLHLLQQVVEVRLGDDVAAPVR